MTEDETREAKKKRMAAIELKRGTTRIYDAIAEDDDDDDPTTATSTSRLLGRRHVKRVKQDNNNHHASSTTAGNDDDQKMMDNFGDMLRNTSLVSALSLSLSNSVYRIGKRVFFWRAIVIVSGKTKY